MTLGFKGLINIMLQRSTNVSTYFSCVKVKCLFNEFLAADGSLHHTKAVTLLYIFFFRLRQNIIDFGFDLQFMHSFFKFQR